MTDVLHRTSSDDLVPGAADEVVPEAAQVEAVSPARLRRIRAGRNKARPRRRPTARCLT